jgi:hypothetical protein
MVRGEIGATSGREEPDWPGEGPMGAKRGWVLTVAALERVCVCTSGCARSAGVSGYSIYIISSAGTG